MEDSDSGGLISTEEDQSGVDSSGSSGHARMEKKISRLKMKLLGFQEVKQKGLGGWFSVRSCINWSHENPVENNSVPSVKTG